MATAQDTAVPGIDTAKLEEFNRYAKANPGDVVLGLEATTIWEGQGVENLGKIGRWTIAGRSIDKPTRDFSIQLGAWKEVEEESASKARTTASSRWRRRSPAWPRVSRRRSP